MSCIFFDQWKHLSNSCTSPWANKCGLFHTVTVFQPPIKLLIDLSVSTSSERRELGDKALSTLH